MDNVVKEHTMEGLTGHLNCNITSELSNQFSSSSASDNHYPWSVLWYRGESAGEPLNIEASNKATGGIKYILSSVNKINQILSVVNPKKGTDDGQYICK